MARTVVAQFPDRASADAAYDELIRRGVDRNEISVVGRGAEGKMGLAEEGGPVTAGEGAAVGGLAGLLLGVAAMLIPGIGPIVAVGPIAAALAGAVTGGVTGAAVGGIAGALMQAGVEEEEARYYDERFRAGGVLVSVRTDDLQHGDLRAVLRRHGGDTRQGPGTTEQTGGAIPPTDPTRPSDRTVL